MNHARLTLELPCGCRHAIYEGEVIGIPFSKLPQAVGQVIEQVEHNGCRCPAMR